MTDVETNEPKRPRGRQVIDIQGQRFGRLVVVGRTRWRNTFLWNCQCDCGRKSMVRGEALRRGDTRSCGCLRNELVSARNIAKRNKNS